MYAGRMYVGTHSILIISWMNINELSHQKKNNLSLHSIVYPTFVYTLISLYFFSRWFIIISVENSNFSEHFSGSKCSS